jgi:hypothetical protein
MHGVTEPSKYQRWDQVSSIKDPGYTRGGVRDLGSKTSGYTCTMSQTWEQVPKIKDLWIYQRCGLLTKKNKHILSSQNAHLVHQNWYCISFTF